MSSKLKTIGLPILAVMLLILMVVWMAGVFDDRLEPGFDKLQMNEPDALYLVESQTVTVIEPVPASVEARDFTSISSRLLSRITQIHVRAGDTVTAGQLLVELESSDLEAAAQQVREQIRAITARLTEAENNLERVSSLFDQGVVPVSDLDKANATSASLSAELGAARQGLAVAETAVSYTEIRSPIDGRIVDRFAEPGDTVSPGSLLLSLYNPLSLRIEAHVREQLALTIVLGQNLQVEIPSLQEIVHASVEESVPAAEPGSRSFLIKARLQGEAALLPGMYARLLVPAGTEERIYIPAEYRVEVGQLNLVWVWQDDQSYRRYVRAGARSEDGMLHIISGLENGDQLARPSTL